MYPPISDQDKAFIQNVAGNPVTSPQALAKCNPERVPVRLDEMQYLSMFADYVDPSYIHLIHRTKEFPGGGSIPVSELVIHLKEVLGNHPSPKLRARAEEWNNRKDGTVTNNGLEEQVFMGLRYKHGGGSLYHFDQELVDSLLASDIDEGLPVQFLRLPHPTMYIEFGSKRSTGLFVPNAGIKYALEGAYVNEGVRVHNGKSTRYLEFLITGAPIKEQFDDAHHSFCVLIEDEEKSLTLTFKETMDQLSAAGFDMSHVDFEQIIPTLALISKAILYLTSTNCRTQVSTAKSDALKVAAGKKSPHKAEKAARRAERDYRDCIYVLPPLPETFQKQAKSSKPSESGYKVSPHWRRGFWRQVGYGEGWSQKKLMYIPRTRIADPMNTLLTRAPKNYLAK